jgi:ABC-2 type transport system permease protein
LGGGGRQIAGIPYVEFLVPGLIMMAITQNAFANTSSSLVIGKVQGNIVDVLTPPLSPAELTLGLALGGATRGVVVGLAVGLVLTPIAAIHVSSLAAILYYGVAASLMMSLVGIVAGLWADKFDHIATVTNFVVTPLTFLSGTFYSVSQLPETWHVVAHVNPFFYMIDGFRYGFTGVAEGSLTAGVALMAALDLLLLVLCHRLFVTGYKLKT